MMDEKQERQMTEQYCELAYSLCARLPYLKEVIERKEGLAFDLYHYIERIDIEEMKKIVKRIEVLRKRVLIASGHKNAFLTPDDKNYE